MGIGGLPLFAPQLLWAGRISPWATPGRSGPTSPSPVLCHISRCHPRKVPPLAYGRSGHDGDHYRKPGAHLRRLLPDVTSHRARLWRKDGDYPHEFRTSGTDLYAHLKLAPVRGMFGVNFHLWLQFEARGGLWPRRVRCDVDDLDHHDTSGDDAMGMESDREPPCSSAFSPVWRRHSSSRTP